MMPTWLVFEDERQVQEMILAIYDNLGVSAVGFSTGEEALEWVHLVDSGQYQGELPQLALLDIHLPGKISGIMVGERIRQSPYLNSMVLVLMTAYELNAQEEAHVLAESGCDLLIYKPLPRIDELHRILFGLVAGR